MNAPVKIDIAASHKENLGCSKIAQALNLSRWGTAYQLWEQYTGRAPWPDIGNELRVALGEPMEAVLKPFVERRLRRELRRDRREYQHPTLKLVGHVDYRASALNGEPRPVVDMKTSLGWGSHVRFGDDETDEVDDDVLLQMQGYLLLTGAETAYVAALVPGPELKIYPIEADDELHRFLEEGVEYFWHCVETDTPPDLTTLEDAARRWPYHQSGKTLSADGLALDTVEELRALNQEIKRLTTDADRLKLALQTTMQDAETLVGFDGKPVCTWKTQTAKRFDTKRLQNDHPEIYQYYLKPNESRVFRLKGK